MKEFRNSRWHRVAAVSLAVAGVFAQYGMASEIRVTETSITENGRIHSLPTARLQTKGYGLTYVLDQGVGFSYTSLSTEAQSSAEVINFKHDYLDLSYSFGEAWRGIFGAGYAVTGNAKIGEVKTTKISGSSYHLGVGYSAYGFEVSWINRLNFPRFEVGGRSYQATSTHYQLGVGVFIK